MLFTKLLCWYVVATYGLNIYSKFQCHKSTGCRGVGRILKGGFPCEAHSSLGGSGGMPPQKFFEIWLSQIASGEF